MARDYFVLGPTPCGEECALLGSAEYRARMRGESKAYINQLKRLFPDWESAGVQFENKDFAHDIGTYFEVCVAFDGEDEDAVAFARIIKNNLPEKWYVDALRDIVISFVTD